MAATKKRAVAKAIGVNWRKAVPAPIVLLFGPESILAERAALAIKEQLLTRDPMLEISDISAPDYEPGQLFTLASPSLFGEMRLIRVADAERMNDAFMADALEYVANVGEGAFIVIRHSGGVRGKKLLGVLREADDTVLEVDCAARKRDSDRADFARDEFRAAKRQISPDALRALLSAFTGELAELAAACQQLLNDVEGPISEKIVDRYYGGRESVTGFAVAGAAIAGKTGEALILLRHALDSGVDPVPLTAAFASKLRTMAKVAGSAGSPASVAGSLGLAPWQVDRAKRDLGGWSQSRLGNCIEYVALTDAAVKGAERDPIFAVERLVRLVAARGKRSE